MLDTLLQAVLALVALGALLWGARGRQEARRRGVQDAADSIGDKISEENDEARERIIDALDRDRSRDDARERLRARLERNRPGRSGDAEFD